MSKGTLYLVPTGLGGDIAPLMSPATLEIVFRLRRFIAESPKSARAFLKDVGFPQPLQSLAIDTLNEHTPDGALSVLMAPLEQGTDCGLVSEAGCPAVADPGAKLVRRAHASGIRVVPLVGPSALLLAMMAAGMNGQCFAFHGYLPVDPTARAKQLVRLERESERQDTTQIFIETPYRNVALFEAILAACQGDTLLCVASNLTQPGEMIATRTLLRWKREAAPDVAGKPTVFLLYRERKASTARRR